MALPDCSPTECEVSSVTSPRPEPESKHSSPDSVADLIPIDAWNIIGDFLTGLPVRLRAIYHLSCTCSFLRFVFRLRSVIIPLANDVRIHRAELMSNTRRLCVKDRRETRLDLARLHLEHVEITGLKCSFPSTLTSLILYTPMCPMKRILRTFATLVTGLPHLTSFGWLHWEPSKLLLNEIATQRVEWGQDYTSVQLCVLELAKFRNLQTCQIKLDWKDERQEFPFTQFREFPNLEKLEIELYSPPPKPNARPCGQYAFFHMLANAKATVAAGTRLRSCLKSTEEQHKALFDFDDVWLPPTLKVLVLRGLVEDEFRIYRRDVEKWAKKLGLKLNLCFA
eukprot:TRINITY_DN66880_c5_g16_i1.p1 TRINITY_DN66880_c5_g16~~TRINITY_DN66880_c5_g16_i1.p1  ORF type:complete len:349 (-),score=11.12 TRINITY_DN66880_c5_g16_i1:842-1855(-)